MGPNTYNAIFQENEEDLLKDSCERLRNFINVVGPLPLLDNVVKPATNKDLLLAETIVKLSQNMRAYAEVTEELVKLDQILKTSCIKNQ